MWLGIKRRREGNQKSEAEWATGPLDVNWKPNSHDFDWLAGLATPADRFRFYSIQPSKKNFFLRRAHVLLCFVVDFIIISDHPFGLSLTTRQRMNTLTSALRSRFLLKNGYSTTASAPPTGFTYLSNFLDKGEQVLLTKAALTHLDNVGSSSARRKLKRLLAAGAVARDEFGFLPEDPCYQFEEVRERKEESAKLHK